jgi:hypothetical protein
MSYVNEVTGDEVLRQMMLHMGIANSRIRNHHEIVRLVRSVYGFDATTVASVWNMLVRQNLLLDYARVKYILYMCCYMKTYNTFEQYRVMFGVSIPTFKSWVWYFARLIAKLGIVSFSHLHKPFNDIICNAHIC